MATPISQRKTRPASGRGFPDWVNQFQVRIAEENDQIPGRKVCADQYRRLVKSRLVANGLQESAAVVPSFEKTIEMFPPINWIELDFWGELSRFPPACGPDHRARLRGIWSSVCRAVGVLSASVQDDAEVEELKLMSLDRVDYETRNEQITEVPHPQKVDLRCARPEVVISWLCAELDCLRVLAGGPAHDEMMMYSSWLRSQIECWTLTYWPVYSSVVQTAIALGDSERAADASLIES